MENKATLAEIENHYSYYDVILANEALDIQEERLFLAHQADNKKK